jgi:gliding motility-associated-like protein
MGSWTLTSGPGTPSFSPSANQSNAQVQVSQYGTYEFSWTETNGFCSNQNSVTVIFYEPVIADAGPDQVLDFTFSTYLNARVPDVGTGEWLLIRGSGQIEDNYNPVSLITGLSLGENEFSWIVKNGVCLDASDNIVITVNDIVTPTVITPNGDGQNDFLVFPGIEQLNGSEILIYNRWGTEVYRNTDYQNDWEGRDHKDRALIPDTYYYILRLDSGRIIKSFVEIKR